MKRSSLRPLVCGALTSLCFCIACGDDDSVTEPTFEVDESDASVDAAVTDRSPNGAPGKSPSTTTSTPGVNTGATSDGGADPGAADAAAPGDADAATGTLTSGPPDDTTSEPTGDTGESEDCVRNPKTHLEIINACTTAVVIMKTPNLTGLNDDGSLPPLP